MEIKITNEQLSKLREKLGDKELKEMGIELPVEYDKNKIYVLNAGNRYYYKLISVDDGYAWSELANSYYTIHKSETIKECIGKTYIDGNKLQTFDNLQDFAKWLLKVSKS